jgi:hypothetical protein
MFTHSVFEAPLRGRVVTVYREKEIDGLPFLIDSTIEVFPDVLTFM